MDTKQLKKVEKLKCVYSIIDAFTEGKQYDIIYMFNSGCDVIGDDGIRHYLNVLDCEYYIMEPIYNEPTTNTPTHYQGTIQPIDLINAQDLNFNLGNVVKYVCRAGKKQGENILSDLEKAKDYINFEIERVKKWTNVNEKN